MSDLVTWLRAQLDADEAAAQAAYDEASGPFVHADDLRAAIEGWRSQP